MSYIKLEFPCGYKIEISATFLHGEDLEKTICPMHKEKCKKEK